MSRRIQAFLVVLVLATAGSLAYVVSSFGGSQQQTATINNALTQSSADVDSDHDGLTDRQEAYWRTDPKNPDTDGDGFTDGEEVLTGHNPLVKGPNDFLDPSKNLTQRAASLIIGGISTGDLNPASASYAQSAKMLADAMTQTYQQNATIPKDTLTLVDDSQDTKFAYLQAMSTAFMKYIVPAVNDTNAFFESIKDIPVSDFSTLTDNATRYAAFAKEARRFSAAMGERAAQLVAIPVPRSFELQHASAVQLLRIQQTYYRMLASLKEDPLQGSVALDGLMNSQYAGVPKLLYDFSSALSLKLQ